MNIIQTAISDVLLIEPTVFDDSRGFFIESWNERSFNKAVGRHVHFVQDNHSRSVKGVLRGLHYQRAQPQGKLVRVSWGRVFDVAVDLRRYSRTFGESVTTELSSDNQRQLWIPEGFAHGFLVISASADFLYKTTSYYHPESEKTVIWNDPELAIAWPIHLLDGAPTLSEKDSNGLALKDSTVFE